MRINLLPLEYRPQPLINPLRLVMMSVGSFLFFVTILISLFQFIDLQNNRTLLNDINKQLEILRPTELKLNKIEELSTKIAKNSKEIEQIKKDYQNYVDNIRNVVVAMPDQLWLNKFELKNDGNINLSGSTLDFVIVGHFLKRLEDNKVFNKITLKKINEVTMGEKSSKLVFYDYSIELGIGGVKQ